MVESVKLHQRLCQSSRCFFSESWSHKTTNPDISDVWYICLRLGEFYGKKDGKYIPYMNLMGSTDWFMTRFPGLSWHKAVSISTSHHHHHCKQPPRRRTCWAILYVFFLLQRFWIPWIQLCSTFEVSVCLFCILFCCPCTPSGDLATRMPLFPSSFFQGSSGPSLEASHLQCQHQCHGPLHAASLAWLIQLDHAPPLFLYGPEHPL